MTYEEKRNAQISLGRKWTWTRLFFLTCYSGLFCSPVLALWGSRYFFHSRCWLRRFVLIAGINSNDPRTLWALFSSSPPHSRFMYPGCTYPPPLCCLVRRNKGRVKIKNERKKRERERENCGKCTPAVFGPFQLICAVPFPSISRLFFLSLLWNMTSLQKRNGNQNYFSNLQKKKKELKS